ncbi:hypothetical protein [Streptomyces sp.]|uniref:hypothetical protein n=1 Tax=Streptomyces sp. TaxID=1931 RepID=UPI002D49FD0A|nr:hypothetical protein [Streptomyces sp.]HZF89987.1 hypothetical protein [Streptomyces sp.]
MDQILDRLPRLARKRNPQVAAFWGFVLGGLALGIYFRSFIDFIMPIIFVVVMTYFVGDLGFLVGAVVASAYGYFRAENSNKRLEAEETHLQMADNAPHALSA